MSAVAMLTMLKADDFASFDNAIAAIQHYDALDARFAFA